MVKGLIKVQTISVFLMSPQSCECSTKDHVEYWWHLSWVFDTNRQEQNSNTVMKLQNSMCYLDWQGLVLQFHSAEQTKKNTFLNEETEYDFFQFLLLKCNPELRCKVIDKEASFSGGQLAFWLGNISKLELESMMRHTQKYWGHWILNTGSSLSKIVY